MNYMKKEQEKITDQDMIQREKINKGVISFVSITITLAMIAYTACMCLQKKNSYHGVIDNPKKVEECVENQRSK